MLVRISEVMKILLIGGTNGGSLQHTHLKWERVLDTPWPVPEQMWSRGRSFQNPLNMMTTSQRSPSDSRIELMKLIKSCSRLLVPYPWNGLRSNRQEFVFRLAPDFGREMNIIPLAPLKEYDSKDWDQYLIKAKAYAIIWAKSLC